MQSVGIVIVCNSVVLYCCSACRTASQAGTWYLPTAVYRLYIVTSSVMYRCCIVTRLQTYWISTINWIQRSPVHFIPNYYWRKHPTLRGSLVNHLLVGRLILENSLKLTSRQRYRDVQPASTWKSSESEIPRDLWIVSGSRRAVSQSVSSLLTTSRH